MRLLGARADQGIQAMEQLGDSVREAAKQSADPLRAMLAQLFRPSPQSSPTKLTEAAPTESESTPQAADSPASDGTTGEPGIADEKESDAVSIANVPVELRKVGNPLAAAGLDIKTVRPKFTHYTTLTVAPRSPLIRVEFDRKGVVVSAVLLESSGHKDVDNPILDAIYQWRATGKPLESIDPDGSPATVAIEFRIVL